MQSEAGKVETYLNGRWRQQRDYYSKQSARNKRWHQRILLFSTIGALLVPVLLNISEVPKLAPTILSVLVSVALTLDSVYHYGDNWHTFRRTLEALKRERIFFETGVGPYQNSQTAFPLFVKTCEEIMQGEGKTYFEKHQAKKQNVNTVE